jgi:hypothetical protein
LAAYVSFSSGASACCTAEGETGEQESEGAAAAGQGTHHVEQHLGGKHKHCARKRETVSRSARRWWIIRAMTGALLGVTP